MNSFLSGFVGGAADSMKDKRAAKERAEMNDRLDRDMQSRVEISRNMARYQPPLGAGQGFGVRGIGASYVPPTGNAPKGPATLRGLLFEREGAGDPNTLFGHSQRDGGQFAGTRVSDMTIGQAIDFASPSGPYGQWVKGEVGRVATPMGAPQIVGTTLRNAATEMGLPLDARFNEGTQYQIAEHLAARRLAGAGSPAAKRAAWRAEWEGFGSVPDAQLDAAIAHFEQTRGGTPRPGLGIRP